MPMGSQVVKEDMEIYNTYDYYSIYMYIYTVYIDNETHILHANTVNISARKIPLRKIRKNLLKKHEEIGILRNKTDEYFANISLEQIKSRLDELNIAHAGNTDELRHVYTKTFLPNKAFKNMA